MPPRIRRPRRLRRLRKARRARRALGIRPSMQLKKYTGVKYFTETFDAGSLPLSGGWFTCALSSMINHNQYFALFDLGYITRYDVILVPNNGQTVYGNSAPTGRMTYAVSQNFDAHVIANELEILQEDNNRQVALDGQRKIVIRCYNPKPFIPVTLSVEPRSQFQWLNLNSATAQGTLFGGIKYWISNTTQENMYNVYIRVYAMFKEQQ